MRKITSIVLAALLFAVVMPSCKKGENDPVLSLRSRKARVAGEWKATSGEGKYTETGSSPYSSSWSYNGSTYTSTTPSGTSTSSRTLEYTFEKDGTFSLTDIEDGVSMTIEGQWNFAGGVGEEKKKSELVLSYNKVTDPSGVSTFTGFLPFATFEIDELRNDKMVLRIVNKGSGSGSTWEEVDTWVLEAK